MKQMSFARGCLVAAALFLLSHPAARASDLADFQAAFADAWGHYRQVNFYIGRGGNIAVTAIELDDFIAKWTALEERFGNAPPDSYADDPEWAATLAGIGKRARDGLERLDADDLEGAKELLIPIRGISADLRRRNGVTIYADHINELSAAMDILAQYRREVKSRDDLKTPDMHAKATRQGAVVAYLLEKCDRLASQKISNDPEFRRMIDGARESMVKFWQALDKGDARLYRIAIGEVRSYERILFSRFG